MKPFHALALLLPLICNAQTTPSLVGFQGMPWGSSMAAVKAKFPQANEIDSCKIYDQITKDASKPWAKQFKENDSNCVHFKIVNYRVNNDIKFDLEFFFSHAGKLEGVILTNSVFEKDYPNYLAECTSTFDQTKSLLEINYGRGTLPSNIDRGKKSFKNIDTKFWVSSPTEIVLSKRWGYSLASEKNMPDLCEVNITYTKRGVDKL